MPLNLVQSRILLRLQSESNKKKVVLSQGDIADEVLRLVEAEQVNQSDPEDLAFSSSCFLCRLETKHPKKGYKVGMDQCEDNIFLY